MTSLPDVNALLALVAEGHIHHAIAKAWFETCGVDSVAICRVTHMG
jgi:predicted nucleic acid-binding protein